MEITRGRWILSLALRAIVVRAILLESDYVVHGMRLVRLIFEFLSKNSDETFRVFRAHVSQMLMKLHRRVLTMFLTVTGEVLMNLWI